MVSSVSLQYAHAIFDLAVESHNEIEYYDDLKTIEKVFFQDKDVYRTFSHPKISNTEKKEMLKKTLDVTNELLYYLFVLLDNNRFLDLPNIIESYKKLLDEKQKKLNVLIYTKFALSELQKEQLINKLSKHYYKQVTIQEIIDETLIGGIKIVANGQILDSTTLKQLDNLKNTLKKGW